MTGTAEDMLVAFRRGARRVLELDAQRREGVVRDFPEEAQRAAEKTLGKVPVLAQVARFAQHRPAVSGFEGHLRGAAQQALVGNGAGEPLAKRGAAGKQVFDDLSAERGHVFVQGQADVRVAADFFGGTPEFLLEGKGRAIVLDDVLDGRAEFGEQRVRRHSRALHRLDDEPDEDHGFGGMRHGDGGVQAAGTGGHRPACGYAGAVGLPATRARRGLVRELVRVCRAARGAYQAGAASAGAGGGGSGSSAPDAA